MTSKNIKMVGCSDVADNVKTENTCHSQIFTRVLVIKVSACTETEELGSEDA